MIERLLRASISVGTLLLVIFELAVVMWAYFVACFLMLQVDPTIFLLYESGLAAVMVPAVTILISLYALDPHFSTSGLLLVNRICLALGIAFLTEGVVSYLIHSLRVPVHVMVTGTFLAGAALFSERTVVRVISRVWFERR